MALPEILINSTIPGERVALTTLKGALSEAGTEFEIEAAELPKVLQKAGQFRILIDHEIILCEGKAEATKKIKILERGAENSAKVAHVAGASIYFILTTEGLKLSATGPGLASLTVVNPGAKENFKATTGNLYRADGECEAEIPEGTVAGEIIGITQRSGTGVCTIKPAGGGQIIGPGLPEASKSMLLSGEGSYVILECVAGSRWVIVAGMADSGWKAVTFEGVWKNAGGTTLAAAYRKQGNVVRLRGGIATGASTSLAFILPVGFRPTAQVFASGGGFSGTATSTLAQIASNGEVAIYYVAAASTISLDGITFTTD